MIEGFVKQEVKMCDIRFILYNGFKTVGGFPRLNITLFTWIKSFFWRCHKLCLRIEGCCNSLHRYFQDVFQNQFFLPGGGGWECFYAEVPKSIYQSELRSPASLTWLERTCFSFLFLWKEENSDQMMGSPKWEVLNPSVTLLVACMRSVIFHSSYSEICFGISLSWFDRTKDCLSTVINFIDCFFSQPISIITTLD